jgi:hypothetical protein
VAQLVFEQIPLPAQFRLTGGAASDHFGIVTRERELADFQTLYQITQQ